MFSSTNLSDFKFINFFFHFQNLNRPLPLFDRLLIIKFFLREYVIYSMVKFRDQLREYLKDKIPDELISSLPSGFQTIDYAAILNLNENLYDYAEIIGYAVMDLIPYVKSIWLRKGKVTGTFRKPEGLIHICGIPNTEVEHHENNIKYRFDFTEIMFSKGNISERRFLPQLIRDGETIVDMFAGIGYFSLPIGKFSKPKQIFSIELNPVSFKYLKENIEINKLSNIIKPIHGDSKEEVPKLAEDGIKADRIIMGVFPAPFDFIKSALAVIKPIPLEYETELSEFEEKSQETMKYNLYDRINEYQNTMVHFEGVVMGRNIRELYDKFNEILQQEGYKSSLLGFRFVKSFGPKMWHLVLDILVGTI